MSKITIGFAMCGSFCTLKNAINQMKILVNSGFNVLPIMSFNASKIDTRFGKTENFQKEIAEICSNEIIKTIEDAEPIGPKNMTDVMLIAPCTGNTLAKFVNAITDTPVLMAAKSHLRTGKPLVIALATNDGLKNSAQNIGKALNMKNVFFVPFAQDDPIGKPNSIVAKFSLIPETIEKALKKEQLQPVLQTSQE